MPKNSADATSLSFAELAKNYARLIKNSFGGERVKQWATGVGFTSRISFKHFLAGRLALKPGQVENLKGSWDLSAREQAGAESLPCFVNTEKIYYAPEEFFQTPLHTLVVNLCGLQTKMTLADLQSVLKGIFSEKEVADSVELLRALDLVDLIEGQYFVRKFAGQITSVPGQKSLSSKEYFRITHQFAERAWEFPLADREMTAFTFRLDSADIPRIKDLVRDFRKNLAELGAQAPRNSVFQCSLSVFPIYLEK